MNLQWGSGIWLKLQEMFNKGARPRGQGKHSRGGLKSPAWRTTLLRRRKLQRQHRKAVRRQRAGRKHVR